MDKFAKIEAFINTASSLKYENRLALDRYAAGLRMPEDFKKWIFDVGLFSSRYLTDHPIIDRLNKSVSEEEFNKVLGCLEAILYDAEYFNNDVVSSKQSLDTEALSSKVVNAKKDLDLVTEKNTDNNRVFIVHGHDNEALAKTESFVRKMRLEPIILRDQANKGMTVIEKIEHYSDVGFSIVLYTPCDKTDKGKSRARQNVVMEHGYLMGKLGRSNVVALVKGDIEIPSDISGVVYIPMDGDKAWEQAVAKDLRAAGYEADANRI